MRQGARSRPLCRDECAITFSPCFFCDARPSRSTSKPASDRGRATGRLIHLTGESLPWSERRQRGIRDPQRSPSRTSRAGSNVRRTSWRNTNRNANPTASRSAGRCRRHDPPRQVAPAAGPHGRRRCTAITRSAGGADHAGAGRRPFLRRAPLGQAFEIARDGLVRVGRRPDVGDLDVVVQAMHADPLQRIPAQLHL